MRLDPFRDVPFVVAEVPSSKPQEPMKLSIQLQNPEHDAGAIAQPLRDTDIAVDVRAGRVHLITAMLVPAVFDVADSDRVFEAWQRIGELIAIVNGASR